MDQIKIILATIKAIDSEIEDLNEKKQQLLEKYHKLQDECNHEIVVRHPGADSNKIGNIISRSTYCLLCGEYLSPRKYLTQSEYEKLKNAKVIDLEKYPEFSKVTKHNYLRRIKSLYEANISKFGGNASAQEIYEAICKDLEKLESILTE